MAEGSTLKLAGQCKKLVKTRYYRCRLKYVRCPLISHQIVFRFLIDPKMTSETKRFAAEGLSYLTIDADVKDWLVQDNSLIRSLVELAKVTNR